MPIHTTNARSHAPDKIILYGVEGVGKTTWAAQAPNVMFLCAEDGVRGLDVPKLLTSRNDEIKTFNDVLDAVSQLLEEPHDFKTLVIDTIDWLEPLIKADTMATFCQGDESKYDAFGRGLKMSMGNWRRLLTTLDAVRTARGIEIIMLAHAQLKAEESPSVGQEVKRYAMKIPGSPGASPSALLREWCDSLLFATFQDMRFEGEDKRVRANPTGRRVLKTQRAMMWEAKTRWKLPVELPMSYKAYADARGVLSRLPEFQTRANKALMELISHPAHTTMADEVKEKWENEALLGALIQELEALISTTQGDTF